MDELTKLCANCNYDLGEALYCSNCGQKATIHNLSLKFIFSKFSAAFISFDKKLLRSLRDIWVPNKISESFLQGKRSTYVNHIRFFALCLGLFFGLTALNLKKQDFDDEALVKRAIASSISFEVKNYIREFPELCDTVIFDSLSYKVFNKYYDIQDSIVEVDANILKISVDKNNEVDLADIYKLDQDSLFRKYNIETWGEKMLANQGVKILKGAKSMVRFAVGNMLWGIIVMTILMSFFLKLFYWRHKSFVAEHLMQMINFHCVLALILSLVLFLELFIEVPDILYTVGVVVAIVHFLYSLKSYYLQGWFKTFIKGLFLSFCYVLSFVLVFLIIFALSFMFF